MMAPSNPATIQESQMGPATYTGTAPKPSEPTTRHVKSREEREREQQHEKSKVEQRAEYAQAMHNENKEHKKGMADKARSAADTMAAKASAAMTGAAHKLEGRAHQKADVAEEKWFEKCFPNIHEEVVTAYQVTYIDGRSKDHVGKLAITNGGLHFADGNKEKACEVKESVPFRLVESVHMDRSGGKHTATDNHTAETRPRNETHTNTNTRLNVYTRDHHVLQFKNFRSHAPDHISTEQTLEEALEHINHHWRSSCHTASASDHHTDGKHKTETDTHTVETRPHKETHTVEKHPHEKGAHPHKETHTVEAGTHGAQPYKETHTVESGPHKKVEKVEAVPGQKHMHTTTTAAAQHHSS